MRGGSIGFRWTAALAALALVCGEFGYPRGLPAPLQWAVGEGVDQTARLWLWVWNEPADLLDGPASPDAVADAAGAPSETSTSKTVLSRQRAEAVLYVTS